MQFKEIYEDPRVKEIADGILYAVFTDKILIRKWPVSEAEKIELEQNFDKLLECRIFCASCEYRCVRVTIGQEFRIRFVKDGNSDNNNYYDEMQYLDIDSKRTYVKEDGTTCIVTTGGGTYDFPLPVKKDMKLMIRNYVDYYEASGQAYVFDWRMVQFE